MSLAAVLTDNEEGAYKAAKALIYNEGSFSRLGINTPDDIALILFDD